MESGHMEQEFNKLSATVSTLINDFKHSTEEHVLPLQAHYSTLFHSYHACQCRGGDRPQRPSPPGSSKSGVCTSSSREFFSPPIVGYDLESSRSNSGDESESPVLGRTRLFLRIASPSTSSTGSSSSDSPIPPSSPVHPTQKKKKDGRPSPLGQCCRQSTKRERVRAEIQSTLAGLQARYLEFLVGQELERIASEWGVPHKYDECYSCLQLSASRYEFCTLSKHHPDHVNHTCPPFQYCPCGHRY